MTSSSDLNPERPAANRREIHEISPSIKKKWQRIFRKLILLNMVVGVGSKIALENKVGKPVSELDVKDPLRVIALSIQRSIRYYGEHLKKNDSHDSNSDSDSSSNPSNDGHENKQSSSTARYAESMFQRYITSHPQGDSQRSVLSIDYGNNGKETAAFGGGRASVHHNNKFVVEQPTFRCHSFSPSLFESIRTAFGISEVKYYATLGLQEVRNASCFRVITKDDASGKSGSFFFFSSDQRFILKSCTKTDIKTLIKILPKYAEYVKKQGSKTLLPRYLGMYQLSFTEKDSPEDVTMVVMTNFFGGSHKIHCRFDLKGSTFKRFASEKERAKKAPVFKDNDWIDKQKRLTFPNAKRKEEIEKQLTHDTQFLASLNLIDYSLLVGIHESNQSRTRVHEKLKKEKKTGVIMSHSPSTGEIRYFGIVDILTPYRLKKMSETIFTGHLLCRHDISCQPPRKYARRFVSFLSENALQIETSAFGESSTSTKIDTIKE